MKRLFVGIDPGVSGAIAVVDGTLKLCRVSKLPTVRVCKTKRLYLGGFSKLYHDMTTIDDEPCDVCGAVELGNTLGNGGKMSNFVYGHACGLIEAFMELQGIPFVKVQPKDWKKEILKGTGKGRKQQKEAALKYVGDLFPHGRWKDHNQADAVCIALYARQFFTLGAGRDNHVGCTNS